MNINRLNISAIKGVLLDIDGTMYDKNRLNFCILKEIIRSNLNHPVYLYLLLKWLYIFRKERERLRFHDVGIQSLANKQFIVIYEKYGIDIKFIQNIVEEWILNKPLPFLHLFIKKGLCSFLEFCSNELIKIGVYSDYPAKDKVKALGCAKYCELFLASTNPEINVFKPSPKGLLLACDIWNIEPAQLLYIGDRLEIDALAAQKAGCQFVLIGKSRSSPCDCICNFQELTDKFKSFRSGVYS